MTVEIGSRKFMVAAFAVIALLAAGIYFRGKLGPAAVGASGGNPKVFTVEAGDGFRDIAGRLAAENLIRSRLAFEILSLLTGSATKLKPGVYKLSPAMSGSEILSELVLGSHREIFVTIPEGMSVYEIDKILSDAGVLRAGDIISFNKEMKIDPVRSREGPQLIESEDSSESERRASASNGVEGRLFPDTYRFFLGSETKEIVDRFLKNFRAKAEPILSKDKINEETNLILASLIEKEVPESDDRKIVAGILKKRLKAGVPLQVDATICYVKRFTAKNPSQSCYPLTPLDFKVDSLYNTYLHSGLPPAPIGNPGISALEAVLHPKNMAYWYYLSDPKTKKTVFAVTLDEHNKNRRFYLGP